MSLLKKFLEKIADNPISRRKHQKWLKDYEASSKYLQGQNPPGFREEVGQLQDIFNALQTPMRGRNSVYDRGMSPEDIAWLWKRD